ncbi:PLD nuclease N-terminal domain-containing protein [Terracoccus luteus]|uniref:Cardiolipin synthase N-terminal domain-containing protein n=1 Tax=Terracoccus luteus TaxID=53356 RepID=A0A839Q0J6_9MICO|nr:PLD nuclease N-terminal domain-containing protein [Terracoccus luteus]MBB2986151.1 hypothetical protein [Terracoccus luteus]MCP2172259.1 hypothetical protein [Terracoccus luteus]
MLRVVFIALVVFATIYALVDCLQTDRRRVAVMPKGVWLIVALVPVLGPAAWFFIGRSGTLGGWGGRSGPSNGRPLPPGPRGPDDDPDFLRKL